MPVSPARSAAFDILLRVERDQAYASELLHSPAVSNLSSNDHGLATELVMGVLRWRSVLDRSVEAASSQPLKRLDLEVLIALRLGIYQLQFLSRIPPRAAIFESVELVKEARKRSATSFVNGVLRKVSLGAKPTIDSIQQATDPGNLAVNSANPEWLVSRWVHHYGLATSREICRYGQTVPDTVIRMDASCSDKELAEAGIQLVPGLLLSSARRVVSGDITQTRAYKDGSISIQDEGSQLAALLVGKGKKILDCCAAPGTKTTIIAKSNPNALVLASELHAHRARLMRTLVRQPNVRIITADARDFPFLSGFDRILADVPCSGTGTLARHPEIKWRLKPEDLQDLQSRQIAILRSALAQLNPGGRLIYSTCSLEHEENEAAVESVLSSASEFRLVDSHEPLQQLQSAGELIWSDLDSLLERSYLRTIPGVHPCDGFFAAILERKK